VRGDTCRFGARRMTRRGTTRSGGAVMADRPKILLVDDDPSLLRILAIRLQREGYNVETADNGRGALGMLASYRPHMVITDMRMAGMDGMSLFEAIRAKEPMLPVVMLTAHGTIPEAIEATQRGMFAYLTKPFEKENLLETVARALDMFGSQPDSQVEDGSWCEEIVTRSAAMESLLREAWMIARTDASVLIRGQSGTGKELLARAIHRASHRHAKPMVAVNCTAIPEQLFEAELFGHKKGAFTGANQSRTGLLQAAHDGTVLFDEIGDMPLAFQVKLLRMLQEREIRPVGSTETVPVDVRVISATHQDLESAIEDKSFREDLYYRLNVVTLEIPPLAERREDIPLLVEHMLDHAAAKNTAVSVRRFSKEAVELMISASWPGNIRQLRNVVEQCIALTTSPLIPARLVERALRTKEKSFLPFACARDQFECDYLTHLLAMTEGNVAQAARLAERNRSEFYKLLHKHELEPSVFRRVDQTM
jgi:two-component system response regulator GlrR